MNNFWYDLYLTQTEYLLRNCPVIFPAELVREWPAFTDLVNQGTVNWAELAARYGDHQVPVVVGSGEESVRETRKLSEVVNTIHGQLSQALYIKDWHLVRCARTDASSQHPDDPLERVLPYQTPYLFADDWMNNITPSASDASKPFAPDAWLSSERKAVLEPDDFRFCYAGTSGSSTPLHRDGKSSSDTVCTCLN